jgi:hypothetical protein
MKNATDLHFVPQNRMRFCLYKLQPLGVVVFIFVILCGGEIPLVRVIFLAKVRTFYRPLC